MGDIVYSGALGLLQGVAGVQLTEYVAAEAISKDILTVFSPEISVFMVSVITQFFGFGLLAIIVGVSLGRLSTRWQFTSTVCYIALILYLSVGVALVYDTVISNPYWGLKLLVACSSIFGFANFSFYVEIFS